MEQIQANIIKNSLHEQAKKTTLVNYGTEDDPCYHAAAVAIFINYRAIRHAVTNLAKSNPSFVVKKDKITETRGVQKITCLTKAGIKKLIENKRYPPHITQVYFDWFSITS